MSDLSERLSELSDERRLLLELLRKERRAGKAASTEKPVISKPARLQPFELLSEDDRAKLPEGLEDAYPMVRMQAGMLYHMELTPEYPLYLNVDSWHLRTRFVAGPFYEAVRRVVARHEVLRTSFDLAAYSEPMQLVHREARVPVAVIDIRDLSRERQEALLADFVRGEKRRPFDLSAPPLLRFHIHIRSDEEFQFTLTNFHPVMDGWSLQATLSEILLHYTSFLKGEPLPESPRLELGYRDFVALERQALASQETRRFWDEILSDAEILRLSRWPAPYRSYTGRPYRRISRSVPPQLFAELRQLARAAGVPIKSVFVAAHCKVLSLASGRHDIVTGLTVHGRPEGEGGDQLRGLFVNTVPIRFPMNPDTWASLVRSAFEAERALVPHRRFPLAEMQRGRDQLIEVALNVTHFHVHEAGSGGAAGSGVTVGHLGGTELEETNFTLLTTFSIDLSGRGLSMALEGLRAEIADEQTDLLAGHYLAVLQAMATSPDAHHESAILLSDGELQQVLRESNLGEAAPVPASLPQLFAEQAARTPDATALVAGSTALSYADLARRAGRVADCLVRRGVGPEALVGLYMERSVDMVVGLLGILAAGGAYVPIDPAAPQERLKFLLEDSQVAVLLTQERLLAGLPPTFRESLGGAPVICLDAPDAFAAGPETDEARPLVEARRIGLLPESPAYVIYTSGSTGRPKGVVVTHADVVRLFTATERWFHFGPEDVWTLFHSYAFDFSVWELWGALLYGGRLVVVSQAIARSPEDFLELLRREKVTVLNQTPSAFRQLSAAEEAAREAGDLALRWVVFGGEALEMGSLGPWFARHGDARPVLVNMYGITETTVHVTYRPLGSADLTAGSVIGVPIPDLRVYILDRHGLPVPVGAPGEILVGGAGLARGYLRRPELTAERFVPDPWSGGCGERLYRSGDLGRFLPNGELEHLGRIDHQVKVRGFRIELGEIEAALAAHPRVRETAVVARHEGSETRLVGYVVAAPGEVPQYEELRRHLRERLPDYMVPAALVFLDTLPLTVNGKVDRRALPDPGSARPDLAEGYVAPGTPVEEALAASWAEVLGIERVGVNDNFFALGGDSMRILQVLARARKSGLEFSLQQVYEHQTLGQLAAVTTLLPNEEELLLEVPVQEDPPQTRPFGLLSAEDLAKVPEGVVDVYPLARLQAGMVFHMEMTPDYPLYHNVDSWHLRAPFEQELFRAVVDRVVARHPILRTSFDLTTFSEPMQLVHGEAHLPVGVDDVRHLSEAEQEAVILRFMGEAKRFRFDYTQPPLLRFHIHRRSEDSFQFTLTEFHAILDGWSLQSTLAEILRLYTALLHGEPLAEEPPPPAAYREFIYLEQMAVRSEECRRFWDEKLRGCAILRLPRWPEGRRRRTAPTPYKNIHAALPGDTLPRMRSLTRTLGVPLKSLFVAAHAKVLSLMSGQSDVLTGLCVHGRPEGEGGDQARGLFLNTVPLRLDLADGTWASLVRAAFAAERELIPFRRFPLAELQKTVGRQRLVETGLNVTHFHVYEDLARPGEGGVGTLGGRVLEENSFVLSTSFGVDLSGHVQVVIAGDRAELADEQVELIALAYRRVLDVLLADPEGRHEDLDILPEAGRHQILREWNDSAEPRGGPECLHHLVAGRAARDPETVALVFLDQQLTYGELDRRANRLAWRLRGRGIGPERLVAICSERSPEAVVAMLGVLKAGGAFLPLDPAHPAERLAYMLADAGHPPVLTQRHLFDLFSDEMRRCCLALDEELVAGERDDDPRVPVSGDNLAYVIYTSGSTGRPKGTLLAHWGIRYMAETLARNWRLEPGARMLQFASLAFDASVAEIFPALAGGAELHMAPVENLLPGPSLLGLLQANQITAAVLPPSALAALGAVELPALSHLTVAGEACSAELVERWSAGRRLLNGYGPTEVTVGATMALGLQAGERPHIGRPFPDYRVYLLGPRLRPVPLGVPGELCVAGAGLARGYLNQPALTASRFIPNPLNGEPGGRLYRTGDMARYLPDGQIEFLGRIDHQVKVRGFRIEPGEIEAVITAQPSVREAAVVARRHAAGELRLVAYVVGVSSEAPRIHDLRDALRAVLPEYMVPSAWVVLEELPRSPAGKLDRGALPEPEGRPETGRPYVAPRNEMERRLATVWQEVLQIDRVGIEDNLFDLGGHSLLVVRLHSKLVEQLGIQISVTDLFHFPRIAALASHLAVGEKVSSAEGGRERGEMRVTTRNQQTDLRERRQAARRRDVPHGRG